MNKIDRKYIAGEVISFKSADVINLTEEEKGQYDRYELILTNRKLSKITKPFNLSLEFVQFNSTETERLAEGVYTLFLVCYFKGTNNKKIINLVDNIKISAGLLSDTTSNNQKMIDIIESALEGRLEEGYSSYSIQGRSITKYSLEELRSLLKFYKGELYNEKYSQLTDEQKSAKCLRLVNVVYHNF